MTKKTKILMIEDDPFFAQLCSGALEGEGYDVVVATDGEKGLVKVKEENPDLILLDIILPEMNGLEVLRNIRENPDPKIANKLVIILSNLYAKKEEEEGKRLNADDYLIKANITSDELLVKIREVMSKKGAAE